MMYDDGFPMDENLRVTECPRCKNEQFSQEADFCRICGTPLYNLCDGKEIYDYQGNYQDTEYHKNYGNARFCEKCGKETRFFKEKFLKPFNEIKKQSLEQFTSDNPFEILDDIEDEFIDFDTL